MSETKAQESIKLEELIKKYVVDLENAKDSLKAKREMYNDAFNNDANYADTAEKAKVASKNKQYAKAKIANQPSIVLLKNQVEELREEVKDIKDALSGYVMAYSEKTGAKQLELFNGELLDIVKSAKLVKRARK